MDNHRGLSRRCRCWNPITGCTKISAGCKAPRACPDDVVVGIQSPDAPKILPVARPPCLSLQWTTTGGCPDAWVSRRCRCWNPITGCTKISAGCKASVPVPTMDNHRGLSRRCRCWNPVTGCTQNIAGCKAPVPVPTRMDNHRGVSRRCRCWNPLTGCTQNICQLQGLRACPDNGQPQGVVPTMSLLESNHRMHQNIRRLQGPPCLSRRCRCWNPVTGCTKISAGCKASMPVPIMDNHRGLSRRGCPDDVVVGIQSPDAPKYPPVARPPCLSRRCRCWNPVTGCTKISAGCKAPVPVPIMDNHRGLSRRGCPDDVVVGIQSPDAPKYLPVARPPCLSL